MKLDRQLHRELGPSGVEEWHQRAQVPLTELAAKVLQNQEMRFLESRRKALQKANFAQQLKSCGKLSRK